MASVFGSLYSCYIFEKRALRLWRKRPISLCIRGNCGLIRLQRVYWCRAAQNAFEALPGMKMDDPVEGNYTMLLYKPYLDYLCVTLSESASGFAPLPLDGEIAFKASNKPSQKAKVYNWLYRSQRLRRVRITYFDAGKSCQAFNALLYPDKRYDIPLLGIDLLSFGSNRVLCVVDFIPLSKSPEYIDKYIRPLAPLREPFSPYCTIMSDRFFDKETFASEQMIFFRSSLGPSDPQLEVPNGGMYKVYVDYVNAYLNALNSLNPRDDPGFHTHVEEQQRAYDQYLAERDPAFRVFSSYFGKEWTENFCSEFLCPGLDMKV